MTGQPITRADVMPIDEVAQILGLERGTVRKYANAGKIPCSKPFGSPVFLRETFTAWLQSKARGDVAA